MVKLELRKGARVMYEPVHSGVIREGKLVRASPNQEEWLVEHRLGKSWVHVSRLRSAEEGERPGSIL